MHPAILVSFNTLKDTTLYGAEALRTNWGNNSFYTYILTGKNFKPGNLETNFRLSSMSIWGIQKTK